MCAARNGENWEKGLPHSTSISLIHCLLRTVRGIAISKSKQYNPLKLDKFNVHPVYLALSIRGRAQPCIFTHFKDFLAIREPGDQNDCLDLQLVVFFPSRAFFLGFAVLLGAQ